MDGATDRVVKVPGSLLSPSPREVCAATFGSDQHWTIGYRQPVTKSEVGERLMKVNDA